MKRDGDDEKTNGDAPIELAKMRLAYWVLVALFAGVIGSAAYGAMSGDVAAYAFTAALGAPALMILRYYFTRNRGQDS